MDVTGSLVPYRDCAAFAATTAHLMRDSNYARTKGQPVRRRAITMLDRAAVIAIERGLHNGLFGARWLGGSR